MQEAEAKKKKAIEDKLQYDLRHNQDTADVISANQIK